jgi:hypothetical protein
VGAARATDAAVSPYRVQACPIKDEFERKARDYVAELPWVKQARACAIMRLRWHGSALTHALR